MALLSLYPLGSFSCLLELALESFPPSFGCCPATVAARISEPARRMKGSCSYVGTFVLLFLFDPATGCREFHALACSISSGSERVLLINLNKLSLSFPLSLNLILFRNLFASSSNPKVKLNGLGKVGPKLCQFSLDDCTLQMNSELQQESSSSTQRT